MKADFNHGVFLWLERSFFIQKGELALSFGSCRWKKFLRGPVNLAFSPVVSGRGGLPGYPG
jgi:hypothetical protein